MSKEQDQAFARNFAIVVLLLLGMMAVFVIIANLITPDNKVNADTALMAPIGQVNTEVISADVDAVADAVAEIATTDVVAEVATTDAINGKGIYDGLCVSCHSSGIPGIPQVGDTANWEPRIASGIEQLYTRAIGGYTGSSGMMMPAKGGNPALSDEEIKAAVDYMVTNSQ